MANAVKIPATAQPQGCFVNASTFTTIPMKIKKNGKKLL
jgi:hypothetical protein